MKLINRNKLHIKPVLFYVAFLVLVSSCGVSKSLKDTPTLTSFNNKIPERIKIADTIFTVGNNQLFKNKQGLWVLYVEGDPLERGLAEGSLTRELLQKQESIFFSKIEEFVPSKTKQWLLRKFLAWFNRKSYQHITNEYKAEIYGVSRFAADDYDYIANDYLRSLYLHGAHDIGHALQDLALVGCSSFAVWGNNSADGNLLIGRNFDFYAGDDFAKNKIIKFVNPEKGYKFVSVTWGGMIGVVSGMNNQGLTVTINAGKSDIPLIAKTPIGLVTREILQYAATIDEAIAIAKKRKVFVSEAILVGSAKANKAVSIEMSPKNFGVYEVPNASQLICANHFQSNAYAEDKNNLKHKAESHSNYRYKKMIELLDAKKVTPQIAVDILRDREGLKNKKIGFGNEKALNQLLAHHAIVFKPKDLQVWISSAPYQLGEFSSYNLNDVFKRFEAHQPIAEVQNKDLLIKKDAFIGSKAFKDYEAYRKLRRIILEKTKNGQKVEKQQLDTLKKLNPDFWESYFLVGEYYYKRGYLAAALPEFKKALSKEVTTIPDKENIEKKIKKIKRKIK